jgi:hypothetical protein
MLIFSSPKAVDKKKKMYAAKFQHSITTEHKWIPKTLAADNTNIYDTNIHWYGLTDNLEATWCSSEIG